MHHVGSGSDSTSSDGAEPVSFTHGGSGRFSGQHARGVRDTRYGLVSVFENNTIDIDYGYVEALGDGRVFE